jgi:PAS domain S-box-containing protein
VPGSLTLAGPGHEPVPCRAEGGVVQPRTESEASQILLRLIPKSESPTRFAVLTRRIEELNREIARRTRTEAELREQREWLRVTLTSIGDGVIATDNQGRVLFLNPVAELLTGWTLEDAVGRPSDEVFRIVNEQTREPVDNPIARVLREGKVVGLANHTILISKDGGEWPIADSGAPIRDERGHILGVVMVFLEITERKRTEEQLQEQARALREADRRKDEYLAMLAHELRNPLAATSNAVRLMEDAGPGSPAYARALAVLKRQIQQQRRMVDDLLDVSRLTRGAYEVRPVPMDLAALCRLTLNDHHDALMGGGHTLSASLPEKPVWVHGDEARLAQVLVNLLTNAVKFTEAGGRIEVQLETQEENRQAMLVISDTGIGVPPELLPRIFEPFTQGEQTLARSSGGLGLGLALVKRLVSLHAGEVRAHSPGRGQGATFTVLLPLADQPEVTDTAPLTARAGRDGLRVLLIEDNRDAAETLGELLQTWGFEARIALSGLEGVEAAFGFRPDVVLCDLGLPGMDGYQVAARLRRDGISPPAKLVALTGYGAADDRKRSAEAGFSVHLIKPVDLASLEQLLHELQR